jgi:hypothetical protein
MIVPAMNSKELYKEIHTDLEIVFRKAGYLTSGLRREAVKSKTKYIQRIFDYKSKRQNKWFIVVDYYVVQPTFMVVVYYIDNCGLNGVRINWNNKSLTHFTSHFLERYNERFLMIENLSKLEILKKFIPKNPIEVIRSVSDSDTINNRIFGRFKEGIGLGFDEVLSEDGKEIHHFKTFISNEMIFESQLDDFNLIGKEYDAFWDETFKNIRRRA